MSDRLEFKIPDEFSLVLGGPLYQFFMRTKLSTSTLELTKRRAIVISLITWLPLLLLSIVSGQALSHAASTIKVPFIYDVDVHARFLLALPLMLAAELFVHQRIRPIIQQFIERRIISPPTYSAFEALIKSAIRLRDWVMIEVLLIVLVFTAGHFIWTSQMTLESATWYAVNIDKHRHYSLAGYWYAYVSVPIFQFILLRWYFRIFIWARFLWQISRLDLHLVPTHPDGAGGLGFLSSSASAYVPLLLAYGVMLAGLIANHIFYNDQSLLDFKQEIVAAVFFLLIVVLGPLCVFAPHLTHVKRKGLLEYGALASRYVREFDDKWLRNGLTEEEPLIGSGDIQSLNDLAGSFEVIQKMQPFPFNKTTVLQTAVVILLPVLPLTLTLISLEDLIKRLLGVLL